MRKEPWQVHVGDVLFEANRLRKEVVKWEVVEIYIKDYKTMRTVVVVKSQKYGLSEFSASVVVCWHNTSDEAFECLEEMLL